MIAPGTFVHLKTSTVDNPVAPFNGWSVLAPRASGWCGSATVPRSVPVTSAVRAQPARSTWLTRSTREAREAYRRCSIHSRRILRQTWSLSSPGGDRPLPTGQIASGASGSASRYSHRSEGRSAPATGSAVLKLRVWRSMDPSRPHRRASHARNAMLRTQVVQEGSQCR